MFEPYHKDSAVGYNFQYYARGSSMQGSSANNATLKPNFYDTVPASKSYTFPSSLDGYKNSLWREQVSEGVQAGTPASGTFETYEATGNCKFRWIQPNRIGGGYYGKQEKFWYATGFPPYTVLGGGAASLSEANNMALTKLYQKIRDATHAMQAGVSLGEYAETVRMMRTPLEPLQKGLYRYLDDVKRQVEAAKRGRQPKGRRAFITRMSEIVAGAWLANSFGWGPLVRDIDSAFEAMTMVAQRNLEREYTILRAFGRSVGSGNFASQSLVGLGAEAQASWYRTKVIEVRYIARVSLGVRDYRTAVMDSWGVTFNDFLPTVWELIPYSFLIDNVSNIGNIINAASTRTSAVDWVVKTTRNYSQNELKQVVLSDWGTVGNTGKFARRPNALYRKGTFTRELPTGLDVPSLEFHRPSAKQLLNWAALFRASRLVERVISRSLPGA